MHYVEAFTTAQENFLPLEEHPVPGAQRFQSMTVGGVHYHINYLTPYWDPQGGFQLDLTYIGGEVDLDRHRGLHQLIGQFATVKSLPDLTSHLSEDSWPGRAAAAVLRWLAATRLAVRAYGAGGLPSQGEYFTLGGDTLFRGFGLRDRQGSVVWVGSVEWRVPLARRLTWNCIDHVATTRNIYGALFYDAADALVNGRSYGPVAHGLGAGLRVDVTWFGFVERCELRFDVAKAVNVDTPVQFWFGINMPF